MQWLIISESKDSWLRWKSICEMQMYSDSCLTIANAILEKGNKVLCRKEHKTRRDKIQKNRGEMRHSEN